MPVRLLLGSWRTSRTHVDVAAYVGIMIVVYPQYEAQDIGRWAVRLLVLSVRPFVQQGPPRKDQAGDLQTSSWTRILETP